jgi:hypothetical protein
MTSYFQDAHAEIEGSVLSIAAATCNSMSVSILTKSLQQKRGIFCLRTGVWLSWTLIEPRSDNCAHLKLRY